METIHEIPQDANNIPLPTRELKDYLVGPKDNILPAHGWTYTSVLFNHLEENVTKVVDNLDTSLAAVIIRRDRPSDRAMAADAIADALIKTGIAAQGEFTVIPATPKEGDADSPILPHTNLILCTSSKLKDKILAEPSKAIIHERRKDETDGFSFYMVPVNPEPSWYIGTFVGLSDRLTRPEFLSAFFDKLVGNHDVITFIQEHHDRVPDAQDIPFVVRVLLEYADFKPCQVWMPKRRGTASQRQNAIRLYMPPPTLQLDAIKAWKALLTSPSFTFVVDCRGRATPFRPDTTTQGRPMECTECLGLDHYKDDCPITTSPGFQAVHINDLERDDASVGTSLGTIRNNDDVDGDGFKKVTRRRFNPSNRRGGFRRQGGYTRDR